MVKVEYEKSEYEQERDARIARNEAFMRSLGLGGGLAGPEEPKKPKKPRKKRPRGSEPREGSRKSGRIAGEIAPRRAKIRRARTSPKFRHGCFAERSRGTTAAATWIFRGAPPP